MQMRLAELFILLENLINSATRLELFHGAARAPELRQSHITREYITHTANKFLRVASIEVVTGFSWGNQAILLKMTYL